MSVSPTVLYDGECGFCNRWVRFILKNDARAVFRFAPLQSRVAGLMLERCGQALDERKSIVLISDDHPYTKSRAVIEILTRLGFPWSLANALRLFPVAIRDWAYDFVARRRYTLFGTSDNCPMPTIAERSRFIN
jgi:predicted DCC family thiol-disulfide oxidoreductase YuxK